MTGAQHPPNAEFQCLSFPGRSVLVPLEIASRLGVSLPQVHALIEEGELASLHVGSKGARRKTHRIPIESYAEFIVRRLSGPHRAELLRQLPRSAIEQLHRDVAGILAGSA